MTGKWISAPNAQQFIWANSPSVRSSASHVIISLLNPVYFPFNFPLLCFMQQKKQKQKIWPESVPNFYISDCYYKIWQMTKNIALTQPSHPPARLWHGYFCSGKHRLFVATSPRYIAPGIFVKSTGLHWTTAAVEWAEEPGALSHPSVFKDNDIPIVSPDNNGMIGSSWATNLTPNSICRRIESLLFS